MSGKEKKKGIPHSLLDEIRAHDIYTLYTPELCPALPGVSSSVARYSPFSTLSESINANSDSHLYTKNNPKCKKFGYSKANKSFNNLPDLEEEENIPSVSYVPSILRENCSEKISALVGEVIEGKYNCVAEQNCNIEDLIYMIKESSAPDENVMLGSRDIDCYDVDCSGELSDDESWVDLSKPSPSSQNPSSKVSAMSYQSNSPDRVTPLPFGNGEEYLRLLREAQKESNQSSARVSLASSRRETPRDSPKSPPNSPNTEMVLTPEEVQLKGVYINYYNRLKHLESIGKLGNACSLLTEGDFVRVEKNTETDWIWDWSSRPDQSPPKEWRFVHPRKGTGRGASIRRLMVGNSSLFSRDVLYTLLITNVLSLLLGTGIGIWLSKRSGETVTISAMPIN